MKKLKDFLYENTNKKYAIELHSSPFYKSSKWLRVDARAHVAGPKSLRTHFDNKEDAEKHLTKSWGPNKFQTRIVEV
jgi:hypothetical protein